MRAETPINRGEGLGTIGSSRSIARRRTPGLERALPTPGAASGSRLDAAQAGEDKRAAASEAEPLTSAHFAGVQRARGIGLVLDGPPAVDEPGSMGWAFTWSRASVRSMSATT